MAFREDNGFSRETSLDDSQVYQGYNDINVIRGRPRNLWSFQPEALRQCTPGIINYQGMYFDDWEQSFGLHNAEVSISEVLEKSITGGLSTSSACSHCAIL